MLSGLIRNLLHLMIAGLGPCGDHRRGKYSRDFASDFGPIAAWKMVSGHPSSASREFGAAFDV
jgi:hypothetical protein